MADAIIVHQETQGTKKASNSSPHFCYMKNILVKGTWFTHIKNQQESKPRTIQAESQRAPTLPKSPNKSHIQRNEFSSVPGLPPPGSFPWLVQFKRESKFYYFQNCCHSLYHNSFPKLFNKNFYSRLTSLRVENVSGILLNASPVPKTLLGNYGVETAFSTYVLLN